MITSPIPTLPGLAGDRLYALPFPLRILLENALRHSAEDPAAATAVEAILNWQPQEPDRRRSLTTPPASCCRT